MNKVLYIFLFVPYILSAQVLKLNERVRCEPPSFFQEIPLSDICDILVTRAECKQIKKEYQIDCSLMSEVTKEWSLEDFREECSEVTLEVLKSFVSTLWDLTTYSILIKNDPLTQAQAGVNTQLALSEAKLLFDVEYDLAVSDLEDTNQDKSLINIANQISLNVWDKIYSEVKKLINNKIDHFSCLNNQGKSELMCSIISEIFVPPLGAFAILKYGQRAQEFTRSIKETVERYSHFAIGREYTGPLAISQVRTSKLKNLKGRKASPLEGKLSNMKIVSKEANPNKGYGESYIVTLKDGTKAIWKPNQYIWHQNYRAEVLAYELDQKFEFDLVSPTVERSIDGRSGSLQMHVDSVPDRNIAPPSQHKFMTFQYLILNYDDDAFFKANKEIFSIDHGAAFTSRIPTGFFPGDKIKIKNYMRSKEGKKLAEKLSQNLTPEFEAELAKYLGKKDAKRTIIRMKRLIRMAK